MASPARPRHDPPDGRDESVTRITLRRFQFPQLLLAIELLLVFYFSLRPAVDPDYGWHIANGRHVLDGLTLAGRDIYSWTASGLWVAHEWLAELVMSVIHQVAGPSGNSVVAALCGLLVYAVVTITLLRCVEVRTVALALPICFVGAMQSLAVRPLMLELLYLAVLILVIESHLRSALTRRQFVLCIGTGAVLWANTHGSFLLLPVVLGITSVELLAGGDHRWRDFLVAALLSMILFVANPWTIHLYAFALQSFSSDVTLERIQEWQRPDLFSGPGLPLLLQLLLAAIGLGATVLAALTRSPSLRDGTRFVGVLRTLAFGVLAMQSGRHIVLFGIAGAAMIASGVMVTVNQLSSRPVNGSRGSTGHSSEESAERGTINFVAALVVAVAVAVAGWNVISPQAQRRALAQRYPVGIVDELNRAMTPADRLLNEYRWGGFLIERNALPVFIDGRSELYGDRQLERYASIVHLRPGWQRSIDSLGITLVLMPRTDSLTEQLQKSGWVTLAADSVGALLRRSAR